MQADFSRRDKGRRGEKEASDHLKRTGYKILERNFRTPCGEIDIIAVKKGYLHFFEVKARHGKAFGTPLEAMTTRKQRHIRKTAEWYLLRHAELSMPCLFGVIGVDLSMEPPVIECVVDAFA